MAVFGRSNFYLAVGDQANQLFDEPDLDELSRQYQKPPRTLAMLELITVFQFVETLPDHQAAEALRKRVDWKYALHLPLSSPGMDAGMLCDFRKNLLAEPAAREHLKSLLNRLSLAVRSNREQLSSLQPDQVVSGVCRFSRLSRIWETLNQAMDILATRQPDWLLNIALAHWYERYGGHRKNLDLNIAFVEMVSLAQSIGADGNYLLEKLSHSGNQEVRELFEVCNLREIWQEEFEGVETGKVVWRKKACSGCSPFTRLT